MAVVCGVPRGVGSIVIIAGLVSGCSLAGSEPEVTVVRPARTSIPEGTADPGARDAVATYEQFVGAADAAQQKPRPEKDDYPADADFTRYSFDPILTEYRASTAALSAAGTAFAGTPPQSHLTVESIALDAAPWPTVTLSDCRTGRDAWQVVDTKTGKGAPEKNPSIPVPYGATVTMVYTQLHWGVSTIVPDPERTCPG